MATVNLGSATPGSYGAVAEIYGEGLRMPGMLRKSATFAPRYRKFEIRAGMRGWVGGAVGRDAHLLVQIG